MSLDNFKSSSDDGKRYRDEKWMREKYEEEGLNFYEIADKVGTSYSTISKWANRHGIEARGSQESKYPTKGDVVEGLKHVAEEAGNDFTARDVEDIECAALVNQCKKKFGSFNKAKKQITSDIYTSDKKKGDIPVNGSSEEFAYILGVVVSDGWLSSNRIGLDVTHKEFADKFIRALGDLSGREGLCVNKKKDNTGTEYQDVYRAAVRWKRLFNILNKEYKIEDWNSWILNLSKNQLKCYIQGVYESEGTVGESGYILSVKDGNHASSYLYGLTQCLEVKSNNLTYRVNPAKLPEEDEDGNVVSRKDSTMCTVYVPSKYRSRFKEVINPTIKCGPSGW